MEFAVGDIVCLKGAGHMPMCVEMLATVDDDTMTLISTHWFDHTGCLHRDRFDARCLVKMEPAFGPAFREVCGQTIGDGERLADIARCLA